MTYTSPAYGINPNQLYIASAFNRRREECFDAWAVKNLQKL